MIDTLLTFFAGLVGIFGCWVTLFLVMLGGGDRAGYFAFGGTVLVIAVLAGLAGL